METCCQSNSSEKPSANADVKNSNGDNSYNNDNNNNNNNNNPGQKTRPHNNQQKKKICKIVDFAVPADHSINLKESEKKDKYLDLSRELKKL